MKSIAQLPPRAVLDGLRNMVDRPVREDFPWRRILATIRPDRTRWNIICDRCSDLNVDDPLFLFRNAGPYPQTIQQVQLLQYRQVIARGRDLVVVSHYIGQCTGCQTWWWFRIPGYQVLPPSHFRPHRPLGGVKK